MKRITTLLVLVFLFAFSAVAQTQDERQIRADELFNEGNSLLRAGNLAEAVDRYQQAIQIVEDHRYYYQKAVALLRMQRFEDAVNAFNRALELGSDMETVQLGLSGALMGMGEQLFSAGNYSGAINQYKKAIELNPDPRYYNRLGIALRRDNRENEAVDAFRKAVELDPTYSVGYVGLGGAYVSLGRFDDAIEAYTTALELDPTLQQARLGLATAYTAKGNEAMNRGQIRNAIESLQKAVEVHPQHGQAYLLLAVAHNRLDQPQQAEENARLALEHRRGGQRGSEYFELGVALRKQGRIQEAIRAFEEAARDPRYRRNAEYELEELRRR